MVVSISDSDPGRATAGVFAEQALGVHVLTVIAKIKPGQMQALIQVLKEISEKPFHNPYVHFGQDRITHFARWFIIENHDIEPLLVWEPPTTVI